MTNRSHVINEQYHYSNYQDCDFREITQQLGADDIAFE